MIMFLFRVLILCIFFINVSYSEIVTDKGHDSFLLNEPEFLKTLKKDDIKSGIGEILHYYLVDGNEKVVDLMNSYEEILDDSSEIIPYIYESLLIKKRMIEVDEFDQKQRRIFNYGHTFGHAIESITNYEISHGQAVTLGIDMANYISCNLGFIDNKTYKRINKIIQKNIPNFSLDKSNIDEYMKILSKDFLYSKP